MYTVMDILKDIQRGIFAHNMNEDCFSYRIVYFVKERNGESTKHYLDTSYSGLRQSLENIIRGNLTLTNTLVIAQTTVRENGKCVYLLSRSYSFSLDEYFRQIYGNCKDAHRNERITYGKYATRLAYKQIHF